MHLVNRVPKRVAGEGAPDVMHYYAGFEKIRNEARVASKTPEDAGFAGQLLGRAVASVVGTEGVSEEDPLMKVERMEERMQAWEKGSGVRRSSCTTRTTRRCWYRTPTRCPPTPSSPPTGAGAAEN